MKNLLKNLLVFGTILMIATSVTSFLMPDNASAAAERCRDLIPGVTNWDCNTNLLSDKQPTEDEIVKGVWIAVANILGDITTILAYLAVGFITYGGFLYMTSSGDPGKANAGKKTLTNAFIGLAIALSASIIMGAIRIALIGDGSIDLSQCGPEKQCIEPAELIGNLIQWVLGISGLIAVAFVVVGGIGYITSSGDPGKAKQAKNSILYAIIGLIIVVLARLITDFAIHTITTAPDNAFINNSTTIAKELNESTSH